MTVEAAVVLISMLIGFALWLEEQVALDRKARHQRERDAFREIEAGLGYERWTFEDEYRR